jgi:PST family polysaccharide transporter
VQLALGKGGRFFRWGVYNAIVTVASFFCGLPWGAKGVAIAYCISTYLILHPSLVYSFRDTPIRPVDFYRSLARPLFASLVMGAGLALAERWLRGLSNALILALLFLLGGLIYLGVNYLLPGGKSELFSYWGYVSILRKGAGDLLSRIRRRISPGDSVESPPGSPEEEDVRNPVNPPGSGRS